MKNIEDLIAQLKPKSKKIRKDVLEMCIKASTGHVTSSMSCIDILVALYYGKILNFNPKDPDDPCRDRFILSKGQASPALYSILGDIGYFDPKELRKFAQKEGRFGVHLQKDIPGAEIILEEKRGVGLTDSLGYFQFNVRGQPYEGVNITVVKDGFVGFRGEITLSRDIEIPFERIP